MPKSAILKRTDETPPIRNGEFVATATVLQISQLAMTSPFVGDFQITGQGRLIVGEHPDLSERFIVTSGGAFAYNAAGTRTFAVWTRGDGVHTGGDVYLGHPDNFLMYDQSEGALGLYTAAGAGFIADSDGSLFAGDSDGAHMRWSSASRSLEIRNGEDVKISLDANGDGYFDGMIYASGGRIYGEMQVDSRLRAGDVDGPSITLGKFERINDAGALIESSEIVATDASNMPWFHVVAGGSTAGGGWFHLGGSGDYPQRLTFDGTDLVFDGTLYARAGEIGGWEINETELRSASLVLNSAWPFIKAGLAYDYQTGKGFWLGNDAGTYKFRIGDPSGNLLAYDGTDLTLNGNIVGGTLGDINGWSIQEGLLTSLGIGFATVDGNADFAIWVGTDDPLTANFTVEHGGYLKSTYGEIAGWKISTNSLLSGTGGNTVGLSSDPFSSYAIYAGNPVPSSAPFSVTSMGGIKAIYGSIAGWQFVPTATGRMYAGVGANQVGLDSTGYGPAIYAGSDVPGTAPFRVFAAGYMVVGTGVDPNDIARIDGQDATYRIWAGHASAASAPFSVTKTGALTASSATVSGTINATAGTFSGNVQVGIGTTHIHLDGAQALIESSTFASGSSGWRITANGDAEFGNITARGSLGATTFAYGQTMATNGSIIVVPASGKTINTVYAVNTPTTFNVDIEDPDGMTHVNAGTLWAVGDVIRIKEPLVADMWAIISSKTDMSTYWRLAVVKQTPAGSYTFPIGAAVLNYKTTGYGNITLTADQLYSPFLSVRTHAGAPWTTEIERVRLGNLSGISGLNGYGLYTNFVSSLTDSRLISHWTMNEPPGNRLDSHGTNTLWPVNTPNYTYSGKIDNAATFYRPSTQYLSIADNASLSIADEAITLAGWVYLYGSLSDSCVLWGKASADSAAGIEYVVDYSGSTGRFRFRVSNGSTLTTVSANVLGAPSLSTWYYIVAWHDPTANTINIQINDGTADSTAHSAGAQNGAAPFTVGSGYNLATAVSASTYVDSLTVWKGILTADEKTMMYANGQGSDYPFSSSYGGIIAGVGTVGSTFYGVQLRSDGISTWRNNQREISINSNGFKLAKSTATRMSIGNANDGALMFLSNYASLSGSVAGLYLVNQSQYGLLVDAYTQTSGVVAAFGSYAKLETRQNSVLLSSAVYGDARSGSGIVGDYIRGVTGTAVGSGSQGFAYGVYAEFTGSGLGYALYANYASHIEGKLSVNNALAIKDGLTAPATMSGYAQIYVDSADGDLKVKFADGTVKTIVTDT